MAYSYWLFLLIKNCPKRAILDRRPSPISRHKRTILGRQFTGIQESEPHIKHKKKEGYTTFPFVENRLITRKLKRAILDRQFIKRATYQAQKKEGYTTFPFVENRLITRKLKRAILDRQFIKRTTYQAQKKRKAIQPSHLLKIGVD